MKGIMDKSLNSKELMVPEAGLEPARSKAPRDFKSLASTKFRHSGIAIGKVRKLWSTEGKKFF